MPANAARLVSLPSGSLKARSSKRLRARRRRGKPRPRPWQTAPSAAAAASAPAQSPASAAPLPLPDPLTYTATVPAMMPATAATPRSTEAAGFALASSGHQVCQPVPGRSDHEEQHVGRPVRRRPRCRHGRDQRVDRFRPAALPSGHPRLAGPCPHACQTGHHRGGRCRKDRGRSRHDPARNRSRRVHVFARAGGHPPQRRGAAGRADRPGRRPAAHRPLAERPGRDRRQAVGARRDRRDRRGARRACSRRSPTRRSTTPRRSCRASPICSRRSR